MKRSFLSSTCETDCIHPAIPEITKPHHCEHHCLQYSISTIRSACKHNDGTTIATSPLMPNFFKA